MCGSSSVAFIKMGRPNLCNCLVVLIIYYSLPVEVLSVKIACELVDNCTFAVNLLSQRHIPPPEVWNFLKVSKCGYDERTHKLKIWCPKLANCKTPTKELGTCTPTKTCIDSLNITETSEEKGNHPIKSNFCGPYENPKEYVCCPWSKIDVAKYLHKLMFRKEDSTKRKKRGMDYPWFTSSKAENNIFANNEQSQFNHKNNDYGSGQLGFSIPTFDTNSEKNLFTQQNFLDRFQSGQTNSINQFQNSLQKQTKMFQDSLQSNQKKNSEAGQNIYNSLLNSWHWSPEKTNQRQHNLTEETSDSAQEICMTPDKIEGTCKQIHQCPSFVKALGKVNVTDYNQAEYLKKFRCNGSIGTSDIKVCCTENPIVLPGTVSRTVQPKADESTRNPLDSVSNICGRQSIEDKITGGTSTGLAEFPWTAALYYTTSKGLSFGCGGSIISNRYVLTAAHCVNPVILRQAGLQNLQKVVLGEYDRTNDTDCIYTKYGSECADPPQSFSVERIIEHELFKSNDTPNDIAILRLEKDINFSDFIRPICLPSKNSLSLKVNETLAITGWGRTETGESSPIKRKARIPFINKDNCGQVGPLTDGQICLGSGSGSDSCKGDSGGPVMTHNFRTSSDPVTTLVGIISFGFGKCGTTTSVSTYVPYYLDWIFKNIS